MVIWIYNLLCTYPNVTAPMHQNLCKSGVLHHDHNSLPTHHKLIKEFMTKPPLYSTSEHHNYNVSKPLSSDSALHILTWTSIFLYIGRNTLKKPGLACQIPLQTKNICYKYSLLCILRWCWATIKSNIIW